MMAVVLGITSIVVCVMRVGRALPNPLSLIAVTSYGHIKQARLVVLPGQVPQHRGKRAAVQGAACDSAGCCWG